MPLLVKIAMGDLTYHSRDRRELAAAREAGFDIRVLSGGAPGDPRNGRREEVGGFDVLWFAPSARFLPGRYLQWARMAAAQGADVLSCHDVYALLIGWLSRRFTPRGKRPALVYDAHEFEPGRAYVDRSGWLKKKLTCLLERLLIRRCAFVIMVNDSIADATQALYRLHTRPLVVRSTPPLWHIDEAVIAARRAELCRMANAPEDAFWLMNHGSIRPLRGIESLIHALAKHPQYYGALMGTPVSEAYAESLWALARKEGVADRLVMLPPVAQARIWEYAGAADAALILIHGGYQNHYWSLPNKFFENIQSLTPIVCSDYPEMRRLVDQYHLGLAVDPDDPAAIAAAIETLRTDRALYARCKDGLRQAKQELCWEKEKLPLIDAYRAAWAACQHRKASAK